jgi:hypothetical protein
VDEWADSFRALSALLADAAPRSEPKGSWVDTGAAVMMKVRADSDAQAA